MKRTKILIFLLISINYAFSQDIHNPAEILKIMEASKLSYEIKILDKSIECKDYSDKLNYHDCYRVKTDSGLITYKFSVNDNAKPLFKKAEDLFQTQQYDSALVYYQLSLKADSGLYKVMTYIGQLYEKKGDVENAMYWYKKAISNNYIDYMAHWFLADLYWSTDNIKDAVDEIVIAQILNRNNKRITNSMTDIFKKAKLTTNDWSFNPQMELRKISEDKISIAFDQKWTGYAIAKAIWTFEPGYKESMGVNPGSYSTLEDKECLFSLMLGLDNAKINIKKDPQLMILRQAFDKKYLNEYILYEIVLPQNPGVAFQLPEQTILEIKDYILNCRNKK
jgi:tetratricopeptide (TPR) repeat protein